MAQIQTMGEWRVEKSPMPYINEDHVDETVGFGQCAIGKIKVDDDEEMFGNFFMEMEQISWQHAAMGNTMCCGDGICLGRC